MALFRIIFSFILVFALFSCGSDDDICVSGEATPRVKIKFKTKATGKPRTLDSLYVSVAYGDGIRKVISGQARVDSIMIPLRVDSSAETELYFRLTKHGDSSAVKVNYTTKADYVSPACGIKKVYENVTYSLEKSNPVVGVESVQTEIINEQKTHFNLLF